MYMEAYGGATSIAEGIIKKALSAKTTKDETKKALSKNNSFEGEPQWNEQNANSEVGVSPVNNEGGIGSKANPQVVAEMNNYEATMRDKAERSMTSQIEELQAREIYLNSLVGQKEEENQVLENKLGKRLLRK